MIDRIRIRGARENNLKNISLDIPRDKLVVLTGVSGSGKSSLAFDTLFAEGQMRYVESLSSYARQFLGQMGKPDVDSIDGLSPAISIEQKTTSQNPRSTVGTVTEIYDYLRLLWARVGIPHCPECGREIRQQSIDQIVDKVMLLPEGTRFQVLAPVAHGQKGTHQKLFDQARKNGFARVRVDGNPYDLSEEIALDKNKKHSVQVVVDRLVVRPDISLRLSGSIETAVELGNGLVVIHLPEDDSEQLFSQSYACPDCGISLPELSPRMFSFNNPYGACPGCTGLGYHRSLDENLILPDRSRSLLEGAIVASGWDNLGKGSIARLYFDALAEQYGFDLSTPVRDLPEGALHKVLYGTGAEKLTLHYEGAMSRRTITQPFEGVIPNIERRYRETGSESVRGELERYMAELPCPSCGGDRLTPVVLAVTVGGRNISQFCSLSVTDALEFLQKLKLDGARAEIARPIYRELTERLGFLQNVGLDYLTLSRSAGTLSGGESQRIRLATQIGSSLMEVLYILDEPSIGLHQRDNDRLLEALAHLRDQGNSLIVVEHDEDTIRRADWVVDIGPGAGVHGGEIVAAGTVDQIMAAPASLTGQYLSGKRCIPVPAQRRSGNGKLLRVLGAAENNLRRIDVDIPLGTFTCVTGVSGSGKSSLVNEVIHKRLWAELSRAHARPGKHDGMEGLEYLDKVVGIDQSPIGRTPRSNPATYIGLFDDIRALFAGTKAAKVRAYGPGRFSFNVRGGRCEACAGDGLVKIEMHFLPDLYVPCDLCKGKRYNRETLEVHYKGKNIADVLEMTADEALEFFGNLPKLRRKIAALCGVGLGYVKLGQSSTTLSGGEAQRVKLAAELSRRSTGSTFYVLDEPTTGLHAADVHQLVDVLHALVDEGNTVLVIEHNLDVIKTADHVVDLGPEGGAGGGRVVCTGTPEQVAACPDSHTGRFLQRVLPSR